MHMAGEHRGLAWTVLLPMLLLVWGLIAFFQEGNSWKERRIEDERREHADPHRKTPAQESMNLSDDIFVPFIG